MKQGKFITNPFEILEPDIRWAPGQDDLFQTAYEKLLPLDFTATPKHDNGAIFVQIICDYPLVEAIKQNIVKSPVLPDEASRGKLQEKPSDKFVEQYGDYIHLGYVEWKKQYEELKKVDKTPLLFIMTTETKESNVTTIVGLRPYKSESKILPEQTLGRGIRKMFGSDVKEELTVIGTSAFIDFVESIKQEGVELG